MHLTLVIKQFELVIEAESKIFGLANFAFYLIIIFAMKN